MKHKIATSLLIFSCMLFLHACLNSSNKVAEGGIGGSGVTMGRINGFGSIIVNGIEFNTDNTTFIRDKNTVTKQSSYSVGEVVTISGSINKNTRKGIADTVTYSKLIKGLVTEKPPLLATNFEILGHTIHINDLTIYNGFFALSDLNPTDIVEVSGLSDANGVIQASSVALKNEDFTGFEIQGTISNLDQVAQTFALNSKLLVNYTTASITSTQAELVNGEAVTVAGQVLFNNTLFATSVSEEIPTKLSTGTIIELEGIITRFTSATDFDLNNKTVITTANTIYKDGSAADLALNTLVEVEGSINNNGELIIDEIELQHVENLPYLEAFVEAIDYQNKSLVIFGQTVFTNQATIFFDESDLKNIGLNLDQLNIGDYVDAKIQVQNDGSFLALRLSRENRETVSGTNTTQVSFKGTVKNINGSDSSFTLYGIQMISDESTLYLDSLERPVKPTVLFSAIKAGVTLVDVEGEVAANNTVLMHSIIVDIPTTATTTGDTQ